MHQKAAAKKVLEKYFNFIIIPPTDTGSSDWTSSQVRPTFHLNLIGFRLGKNFGFFGELGAGYKGIVNVGVSGRF